MEPQSEKKIRGAEIICVGTELLMGHTQNTNAGYLATQLAELGIPSFRQTVVGDNPERLAQLIRESAVRCDLILFTGGLGPTVDDLTMETAAKVAGLPLLLHEPSLGAITEYFERVGRTMSDNNRKQAMLPSPSIVLPNTNGTAPGAIFDCPAPTPEEPDHVAMLVMLPGPPSEMAPMFTLSVRPILENMAPYKLRTAYVHLIGIGESLAETKIRDLIEAQDNPTIAPYASEGECMFRVTQRIESENDPDLLTPMVEELKNRFGEHVYEVGTRSMKEIAFDLLRQQGKTVAFAESCTAGLVSSEFGGIAGVSEVFAGSVVSYDSRIKASVLGVPQKILDNDGPVSEACAVAMARGCMDLMKTDIAVSVTGVAGPDGGTDKTPVGLVYLAIADSRGTSTRRLTLRGNRMRIRKVATLQVFDMIRERLKQA